jgi:hypothetical protein
MPRRPSGPADESSPLRQARLARNWTLEDVAEEINLRTPGGHSEVTPSIHPTGARIRGSHRCTGRGWWGAAQAGQC